MSDDLEQAEGDVGASDYLEGVAYFDVPYDAEDATPTYYVRGSQPTQPSPPAAPLLQIEEDRAPIRTDFELLRPYMYGTPRQFLTYSGEVYCARAHPDDLAGKNPELSPCHGCPHFEAGCEIAGEAPIEAAYRSEDDGSMSGMEPHVRRGIGMEFRPFLVLLFKPGNSHATLPRHLWDNPYADKAMHESNLHFLLTNPRTTTFHTLKGQLRYYGTEAAFNESPYAEYLYVFDEYEAQHHPISLDKSAIEPRVCTLVTEEPLWRAVFQGTPKTISREVVFSAEPAALPSYIYRHEGRTYCYLLGELDKADYASQCGKCPLQPLCKPVVDHLKDVSGDWHAINATGFFGDRFTQATDSYVRKQLRAKAKVGGLASIYGGSEHTLARALNMDKDEAKRALTSFFATLTVASRFMEGVKDGLRTHGMVWTRFGRRRDMRRWTQSQAMKPATRDQWVAGPDGRKRKIIGEPIYDDVLNEDGTPALAEDGTPIRGPRMIADKFKREKDFDFAVRTALNYPIQGTSAELMKMAMVQVDSLIQQQGWNPLIGLAIPQRLELGRRAYRRIVFALQSTVHDELLYLIRRGEVDNVIPHAYAAMQLEHVMRGLGTGFSLELDVEYDKYDAWTAGQSVPTARTYLLRRLREKPMPPNTLIVKIEDVDDALVAGLNSYQPGPGQKREILVKIESPDHRMQEPPLNPYDRAYLDQLLARTGTPARWGVSDQAKVSPLSVQ